MNLYITAIFTYAHVRAVSTCFAIHDIPSSLCLQWGWAIFLEICRVKAQEDILYSGLIHVQHLLPGQMDFECPLEICC